MHIDLPNATRFSLDTPRIVGVLNLTPDSFSDGGSYTNPDIALDHARQMIDEGADIIDVGGESTRPGARRIPPDEQISRVIPVITNIAAMTDIPISIDTTRAQVAEAALEAGASIINDVSAGNDDSGMIDLVVSRNVPYIIMHMQGQPATMQSCPTYTDVVNDVLQFLINRVDTIVDAGLPRHQIILDPGIGFGKTTQHNLELLAGLRRFVNIGHPIMLGTSRKRFIGEITNTPDPADRDTATATLTALAIASGVQLIRVHNVKPNRQAADLSIAIMHQ